MKRYLLVIALLICSIGLDRWTKLLAIEHLKDEPMRDIVGRFFQLVFVENTGAFLSFGANFPDVVKLIVLTIMPGRFVGGVVAIHFVQHSTQYLAGRCIQPYQWRRYQQSVRPHYRGQSGGFYDHGHRFLANRSIQYRRCVHYDRLVHDAAVYVWLRPT